NCGYTANEELAEGACQQTAETRAAVRRDAVRVTLVTASSAERSRSLVVAILPASSRLNSVKLKKHLGLAGDVTPTAPGSQAVTELTSAKRVYIVLDKTLAELEMPDGTSATNAERYIAGFSLPSDALSHAAVTVADIRTAARGDLCIRCYRPGRTDAPQLE